MIIEEFYNFAIIVYKKQKGSVRAFFKFGV